MLAFGGWLPFARLQAVPLPSIENLWVVLAKVLRDRWESRRLERQWSLISGYASSRGSRRMLAGV
eukprot:6414450-Lingulodinium_polyedra.AAC.1